MRSARVFARATSSAANVCAAADAGLEAGWAGICGFGGKIAMRPMVAKRGDAGDGEAVAIAWGCCDGGVTVRWVMATAVDDGDGG